VGLVARDFLSSLARNFDKLDGATAQRLTEQATELAMMTLMSTPGRLADDGTKVSVTKTLLAQRARTFIEENLRDPALQPITVADHLGISRRYLNAVFSVHGQSVERFIWERRLAKCARDLRNQGQRGRAIGDIAFSWGFHSLTHFSQAFKLAYGMSPRDYRKDCDRTSGKA
jgi:AraC family transcriptional regulator, positive regulator of tynA and feaB